VLCVTVRLRVTCKCSSCFDFKFDIDSPGSVSIIWRGIKINLILTNWREPSDMYTALTETRGYLLFCHQTNTLQSFFLLRCFRLFSWMSDFEGKKLTSNHMLPSSTALNKHFQVVFLQITQPVYPLSFPNNSIVRTCPWFPHVLFISTLEKNWNKLQHLTPNFTTSF